MRSDATTTTYELDSYEAVPKHDIDRALPSLPLGKPATKRRFEKSHVLATTLAFISLAAAYVTVTPSLRTAWMLRFEGQIVVVGFLLSAMNLCMSAVVPHALLLLEGRFGRSSLQNYEALLQSRMWSPGASAIWRFTLLFFVALPLGLSVAYKQFLGGTSQVLLNMPTSEYGIDFPRMGTWPPPGDALYYLTTSMSPFLYISSNDQPYPDIFPQSVGYNTLLLSNGSAAILDVPTQATISKAQDLMRDSPGETWNVSATVNAYVAERDLESDFRTNETTFFNDFWVTPGFSANYLYQTRGQAIGFMPGNSNNYSYIGVYPNSTAFPGFETWKDPTDVRDFELFRTRAQRFTITRRQCFGRWTLNTTGIMLIGGHCNPGILNSSILEVPNSTPDPYDLMPELHYVYEKFTADANLYPMDFPWLNVTYAVSVVTAFWARALYMTHPGGNALGNDLTPYNWRYIPADEEIISTRPTLQASPLLFLTLATQPVITLLGLLVSAWLYSVPIGRGFGIVSILSGLDPSTLPIVRGASLSGKLKTDVALELVPKDASPEAGLPVAHRLISVKRKKHRTSDGGLSLRS